MLAVSFSLLLVGSSLSVFATDGKSSQSSKTEPATTSNRGDEVQAVLYGTETFPSPSLSTAVSQFDVIFVGTFRKIVSAQPPTTVGDLRWSAIIDLTETVKGEPGKIKTVAVFVHSPVKTWLEDYAHLTGKKCVYGLKMEGTKIKESRLILAPTQCTPERLDELRRLAKLSSHRLN